MEMSEELKTSIYDKVVTAVRKYRFLRDYKSLLGYQSKSLERTWDAVTGAKRHGLIGTLVFTENDLREVTNTILSGRRGKPTTYEFEYQVYSAWRERFKFTPKVGRLSLLKGPVAHPDHSYAVDLFGKDILEKETIDIGFFIEVPDYLLPMEGTVQIKDKHYLNAGTIVD